MFYYDLYLQAKNDYNILINWDNIYDCNRIWHCLHNPKIKIMVSKQIITIDKCSMSVDRLKYICNKFNISILIIDHYGSYELYNNGCMHVYILYRYTDTSYKLIKFLYNNKLCSYIDKNNYKYILDRITWTGVGRYYNK